MSTDSSPVIRKQHDIELITKLFSGICPLKGDLEIRTCFRLKNKEKPSATPPLKVVMSLKDQRRAMLVNSKNIVDLDDEVLKKLVVARDLTKGQRVAQKAIYEEKQKRQASGEEVDVRFGEVTEVNPQRRSSFREES